MSTLYTLSRAASARQEIKKSRFVAIAGKVDSEAEAKEFVARNSDAIAGHNCFAWRVGQSYRFADDGEPSGTAGKPILQAIDGQNLDNVAVVVSRWFGGVLLGSGGLVRAYGGTAALCLRDAEKELVIDRIAAKSPAPLLTSPCSSRASPPGPVSGWKARYSTRQERPGLSFFRAATRPNCPGW